MTTEDKAANYSDVFLEQMGILLAMRVSQYHNKHKKDYEFINELIICPAIDDFDTNAMRYPANAREHFQEHLGIESVNVQLDSVGIDENKQVFYYFSIYPYVLDDECEEYLEVELSGSKMRLLNEEFLEYLETLSDEILKNAILDIKEQISLGTLKRS